VERFNRTLAREWAYVRAYSGESERRAALGGEPPVSQALAIPSCDCEYNVLREHI
jgi:hypothetical protein